MSNIFCVFEKVIEVDVLKNFVTLVGLASKRGMIPFESIIKVNQGNDQETVMNLNLRIIAKLEEIQFSPSAT